MARTSFSLAIAGALAAMPAVAIAQYGAPSPPPRQDVPRSSASAPAAAPAPGDVLRATACQIGRDAAAGNALLATVPRSAEERNAAVNFLHLAERCVHAAGHIGTSPLTLRGAVAETLYEAQFAAAPAPRTPPTAGAPLARPAGTDPIATGLASAYALADCATPKQPNLVRALLASDPGTPVEEAALHALNPAFSSCITASTQLNVDLPGLRSLLAEALYHWAVVQRDGPAPAAAAPTSG